MESQLRNINDLHIHEIRLTSVARMRSFLPMRRKLDSATAFPESTLNFFLNLLSLRGVTLSIIHFSSFLDEVQANIRKLRLLVLSDLDQNIQILNLLHSKGDSPIYSRTISA